MKTIQRRCERIGVGFAVECEARAIVETHCLSCSSVKVLGLHDKIQILRLPICKVFGGHFGGIVDKFRLLTGFEGFGELALVELLHGAAT